MKSGEKHSPKISKLLSLLDLKFPEEGLDAEQAACPSLPELPMLMRAGAPPAPFPSQASEAASSSRLNAKPRRLLRKASSLQREQEASSLQREEEASSGGKEQLEVFDVPSTQEVASSQEVQAIGPPLQGLHDQNVVYVDWGAMKVAKATPKGVVFAQMKPGGGGASWSTASMVCSGSPPTSQT